MLYWKIDAMPGLVVKKICERFRKNQLQEIAYAKVYKISHLKI